MFAHAKAFDDERFKQVIALLIAVVTVIAAIAAMLQGDASARDDRANRDTKRYATEAMGRKVSGDAQVNFDYNAAYQSWYEFDTLATGAANRGDDAAARRYETLRDQMIALSPLLAEPYFDPSTGEVDIARYEADTYLVEITALNERFLAASQVKDGWDAKSNAYVFHLTLLAVALFLYGLSITIASVMSRWIFSGVGTAVTLIASAMIVTTWAQPVVDLRERGVAIDAYAHATGLAHQDRADEAITAYDEALRAAPDYTNALVGRAQAYAQQGEFTRAIADYEQARANGEQSASVAGELAWLYYLEGRFTDAAAMNRTALSANPNELWIRFDLALSLLAAGQIDDAQAEYALGMDSAAAQVASAQAAGREAPSFLWWSLDDAAYSIDSLLLELADGDSPLRNAVSDPAAITPAAQELSARIKSLAVGLEYTGKPPSGQVNARISPFVFGVTDPNDENDSGEPLIGDLFPFGVDEVLVLFDYEAMTDGSDVLFKVYIDGEEDPSWRIAARWDLGAAGAAVKPLSLAYSDTFVLTPGDYTIAMFVDNTLVQEGSFTILAEETE